MTEPVLLWWDALCAVAAVNLAAWTWIARTLHRRRTAMSRDEFRARRALLLLSAVYVAGCAYRSFVPVFDIPRLSLADGWFASALVGRSVATAAELCFAAQWAVLLRRASRDTDTALGRLASSWIVPLIAVAECWSWYAVLTTSNLGHVIEESLWGLCAALLVAGLVAGWPRCEPRLRPLLALWCLTGVGYVGFMFAVDVPMYLARWLTDEAAGRSYFSVAQGLADASRWVVSHRWDDWKGEVVWMSLYFSVAVWISIALVLLPWPQPASTLRRSRPGSVS